jgi:hypothetical protein
MLVNTYNSGPIHSWTFTHPPPLPSQHPYYIICAERKIVIFFQERPTGCGECSFVDRQRVYGIVDSVLWRKRVIAAILWKTRVTLLTEIFRPEHIVGFLQPNKMILDIQKSWRCGNGKRQEKIACSVSSTDDTLQLKQYSWWLGWLVHRWMSPFVFARSQPLVSLARTPKTIPTIKW